MSITGLLDQVIVRLSELTAGQQFYDPAAEALGDLRLYKWALPPKRRDAAVGQDFPFIVARIMGGRSDQRRDGIKIRLYCGLRTDGDEAAGNADIERLADLLQPIIVGRSWTPYSLAMPLDWFFGDPDHGVQPHPDYFLTMDLLFQAHATATKRR